MSNTAVATKSKAATTAVQTIDPFSAPLDRAIAGMEDKFALALPAHIPAARFSRVAISAVNDPNVMKCASTPEGRKSIFDSLLKCASDGLLPDKREAALVAHRTKIKDADGRDQWVDVIVYMPMVAGILKKVRNSGEVSSPVCQVVYLNDEFFIDFVSDGAPVYHRPNLRDRGEMVGVYAVAKLRDGTWTQPEWMTREQVEEIRQRSKTGSDTDSKGQPRTPSGPWATDYNEMARKTVIRRASKYWPTSTDKDEPIDQWLDKRDAEIEGGAPISVRLTAPGRKTAGAAAALLAADPEPAGHDPATGEVIEAETVEADEAGM